MSGGDAPAAAAPVLSTAQDEHTFEFQKYDDIQKRRDYLGPGWEDDTTVREKIRKYYEVDNLVRYLSHRGDDGALKYFKITLQFPDSLVVDSPIVTQLLQDGLDLKRKSYEEKHKPADHVQHTDEEVDFTTKEKHHDSCKKECANCKCSTSDAKTNTQQQVWILADTAYSSCCIDEVAAEHVGADIVVHYGDACLNAIQKLPAVYVFGKPYLNIDETVAKFKSTYTDVEEKIMLMADAPNTIHLPVIYNILKPTYKNLAYADINLKKAHRAKILGFESSTPDNDEFIRLNNRIINYDNQILEETDLLDFNLFHINRPEPPHLLYLTTKFSSITLYNPEENTVDQGPFPSLMKRYRYMQIARTAGTVGILVNTLSLRHTKEMINLVSAKIKEADKKYYMFVVGKPNVAKLANFESIDIWCILGCGQGGIVIDNTNEFYKPIITPYELELALSPQVSWTGAWVTDFENMINSEDQSSSSETTDREDTQSDTDEQDEDAPEFNPVTGKFVSTSRPLRQIQHLEIDSVSSSSPSSDLNNDEQNQLVKKFSTQVSIKGTVSTSATYLQNREWTGLGSDFKDSPSDEEGADIQEGTSGVARGYNFDHMEG